MLRTLPRIAAAVVVVVIGCGRSAQAQEPSVASVTHAEIKQIIADREATVTVVNFWATWCVPCIEEFPDLLRLEHDFAEQGLDVLFVSADFPDEKAAVQAFLAERGVTQTTYLKAGNTTEFVNAFHPEWTGAIPATFIYDADGQLVDFIAGKTNYDALEQRTSDLLP